MDAKKSVDIPREVVADVNTLLMDLLLGKIHEFRVYASRGVIYVVTSDKRRYLVERG